MCESSSELTPVKTSITSFVLLRQSRQNLGSSLNKMEVQVVRGQDCPVACRFVSAERKQEIDFLMWRFG